MVIIMKRLKKEAVWNPNRNKSIIRKEYVNITGALGEFRAIAYSDAEDRESICKKLDDMLDEITKIKNSLLEEIDKKADL